MGVGQIDIDPMVAGIITLGLSTVLILPKRSVVLLWQCRRTYRGGDGVWFYSWASVSADMFPAMMRYALPGIGNNWQVISNLPHWFRYSAWKMWSKPRTGRQKYLGTVLFRYRLWRDLLVFTTVSNGVLLFLERRYSVV